jgi:hypothetical protein
MDYDELFPGRFIKSGEFKGKDVTLTIKAVRLEALPQERGGDKVRGIIGFNETEKEWVLNRTNGECLKALFGRDTDAWVGRRITLFPEPYQGETAIRVRGTPEITEPLSVTVSLPRKKPYQRTMQPTGKRGGKPAAEPTREPGDD